MASDASPEDGPPTLGKLIRRQRELAELPMRQLAAMAGISNPYLSQIERGLRAPSEEVVKAIAGSLQVSADLLRDGSDEERRAQATPDAINDDSGLTAAQKRALIEAYEAMREVTANRRRERGRWTK